MEKNNQTIFFNKKLYSLDAIKRTIAAFKELGSFRIKTAGSSYEVVIRDSDQEIGETLQDEFANYVLAETRNG